MRTLKNALRITLVFFLSLPGSVFATADNAGLNLALNRAVYQSSAANYDNTGHLATDGSLDTYWQSAPGAEQWVYVDLGQLCSLDRAQLDWGLHPAQSFKIQLSTDAGNPSNWSDVGQVTAATADAANIAFPQKTARYVRILMQSGGEQTGYTLREFRVFGVPLASAPAPALTEPVPLVDGTLCLDNEAWKLQREDFVNETSDVISSASANTQNWLPAIVPGTVLASYLRAGAIPDPRYGDQQFQVSEEFFNSHNFWYRTEFTAPQSYRGKKIFLNFDGINWKADVYLNGTNLGPIDGAFIRGTFDATDHLQWGKPNVLAVLIHKLDHPGPTDHKVINGPTKNGGIIGLDSPTFLATAKWNWMPSIRGRGIGIWNHVYLRSTGNIRIEDPFVVADLSADHHRADLTIKVAVTNQGPPIQGAAIKGNIGDLHFSEPLDLAAGETRDIVLDKNSCPELSVAEPKLWWPNGYGDQPLYQLHLEATVGAAVSDQRNVTFGIRKLSYDTSDNILKILVNDHPIMCNGGNWGMDEAMLQYKDADYDTAVHLHRDMNLVMIRNWVGQVGRDEFYKACDKYGILVWNDFWLANPVDGPDPADPAMFISNMRDKILQIRNHPSVALYCGRNESTPPKILDDAMRQATAELDGTRFYIPDSKAGLVTGGGPYDPQTPDWYFKNRGKTLHSELGLVCVPTVETMRLMMPEKDLWPIGQMWALHDYFQPRCAQYTRDVNGRYGEASDLDDFCEKAQMLNMETSKAMLECWRSNRGSGGLIWMSHPAWPTLICQLYDYYLNPTAAYFGVKKACEPLHIFRNTSTNEVQAANDTLQDADGLTAEATVFDMDGTSKFDLTSQVDLKAGTTITVGKLDFSRNTTKVQFIKLRLMKGTETVSDNFYWRSSANYDYTSLAQMPQVDLKCEATATPQAPAKLRVTVSNPTPNVALMVSLSLVKDNESNDRVLPCYYQDNYFSLLPNETKQVSIEFSANALGQAKPAVLVKGWNVHPCKIEPREP